MTPAHEYVLEWANKPNPATSIQVLLDDAREGSFRNFDNEYVDTFEQNVFQSSATVMRSLGCFLAFHTTGITSDQTVFEVWQVAGANIPWRDDPDAYLLVYDKRGYEYDRPTIIKGA